MRATLMLTATILLLAGCSDGTAPKPAGDDVPDLGLQATSTTGVVRGVVVDEAIRPIPAVAIELRGSSGAPQTATSSDDGFFGFDGLAPGTYFVAASKPGFSTSQSSVDVKAGDSQPPIVKLQLATDASTLPYYVLTPWEGYLQCGLSVIALCGVGTDLPLLGNVTNDRFATTVVVEGVPLFIQSEAVWTPTTSASNELWLWHSNADKGDGSFNGTRNAYSWRQGPSPLVMTSNATEIEESEYGINNDIYLRMFTGSIGGTRNPLDPEGCYPGTAGPDVYCGGVGYSLAQSFTVYTTQFFGYLPPEGWLFAEASQVPPPA